MAIDFKPQSIASALQAILEGIAPIAQTEFLGLSEVGGRALAASVISPKDIPDAPRSAMDGYSFHSSCLNKTKHPEPIRLEVSGKSLAGHPLRGRAGKEVAVRIFTGAVVPDGHDTVIAQELVAVNEATSHISFAVSAINAGANVRQRGEDLCKGAIAIEQGAILGARDIALLASMGIAGVEVCRAIRIAVLSTGDEVTEPGRPLQEGKTFDANRPMLLQMVRESGAHAIDLGIVGDDPESLQRAILHAASIADAVITSGGVSVGEADHTKGVMQSLGEIAFWKLAIKPGRPLAAGYIAAPSGSSPARKVPFFGLPGNPVAAFVTFKAVIEPCIQKLAGITPISRPPIRARLAQDTRKNAGRTEYLRCALSRDADGQWIAHIAASQGAASLKSLVDADGLVVLPHDAGPLEAGTAVDVIVLR
jgi:molybdopterin molybdotransferase